jgi:uncharacterized protein YecE (DUF72 family)
LSVIIKIGTSGYTYSWNKAKPTPFQWYVNQGFNSVEINASFYRFPTESWIKTWQAVAPNEFTFSIKVHRSITHYTKLKGKSLELWKRFSRSLGSLGKKRVDFWLFQMSSSYKYNQKNLETIRTFFEKTRLGNKAVVEFRDTSWWKAIKEIENMDIVFCSVDAPGLPHNLISMNDAVYLRLHGFKKWYNYVYSDKELDKILSKLKKLNANKKAIYLNNNHGMLKNGLYLLNRTETISIFSQEKKPIY